MCCQRLCLYQTGLSGPCVYVRTHACMCVCIERYIVYNIYLYGEKRHVLAADIQALCSLLTFSYTHHTEQTKPTDTATSTRAGNLKPVNMNTTMNNTIGFGDNTVMGASFVGRESDAICDLAALADMSVMQQSPRQLLVQQRHPIFQNAPQVLQQQDVEMCGVGLVLEQMEQGTGVIIEKVFPGGAAHQCGSLKVCKCVCVCH